MINIQNELESGGEVGVIYLYMKAYSLYVYTFMRLNLPPEFVFRTVKLRVVLLYSLFFPSPNMVLMSLFYSRLTFSET
jgi:hypothetical protein